MDKETQEIIKERYEMLPEDIKKVISDADLPTKIENIANKNGLHIDQSGGLVTEVYLVMLGMDKSENFAKNVSKNLGISLNMAIAIEGDINKEIFLPIRESLMEMSKAQDIIEEKANSEDTDSATNREQILNDIENPTPTPPRAAITDPERELTERVATDDFIAEKLSTPSVPVTETPVAPEKKYTVDPYREPMN